MSGTRGKEITMINKKKKEDVIAEEKTECACPMIDTIAMITARDFDESGMFDPDSPHTVLICDLIFKLYLVDLYMDYQNLEGVHNGDEAMNTFARMAHMNPDELEEWRGYLLKYCEKDTLAMVNILEMLKEV